MATNTLNGIEDPDKIELMEKISSHITKMPDEIRDRFKAIKALYDECADLEEEHEAELRNLELTFEAMYQDLYMKRENVLNGPNELPEDLIEQFDEREKMITQSEGYEELEVTPVDVNNLININLGIPAFWLRAMVNHPNIGELITERDRQILQHLNDVRLELHEDYGFGFDLIFFFNKHQYFQEQKLVKKFVMSRNNVIERSEATTISWNEGCNPMQKKVKKKKNGKKVTMTVPTDSFFSFFEPIRMPSDKDLKAGNLKIPKNYAAKVEEAAANDIADDNLPTEDEGEAADDEDIGDRLDKDYQLGCDLKDELIPMAYEYFLNVIDKEDSSEPSSSSHSDAEGEGAEDSQSQKAKKEQKEQKKAGLYKQ